MFKITNLSARVSDKEILKNFNLEMQDGSIHVLMGHNGTGKSSLCKIVMRDTNYEVVNGSITYNDQEILSLPTYEVARLGISLISQSPMAIEGISNAEMLRTALREINNEKISMFTFNKLLEEACEKLKLDKNFIHKEVNVGASGGERKKIELLHVALLKPSFLILDEIDSGLDVDALKDVANFIIQYQKETKCSILIITHHKGILNYLKPDYVHVLENGKIMQTGDATLVENIEKNGFAGANIMTRDDESE